jgi:CheY-like chemotaxis protein
VEAEMTVKKTVLLVDDDNDLVDINRAALEGAGFEVLTAHNGDAGFVCAAGHAVDVAVIDVMMDTPTDGFTLARRLRDDPRTRQIPLLMLTGMNTENEAIGSFVRFSDRDRNPQWLPVDRFADKPIATTELVALVRTLSGSWTFSR